MMKTYSYASIRALLVRQVQAWYPHQVLDDRRPDFGAFIHPAYGFAVADHVTGAHVLATAGYAYLLEGSPLEADADLARRIDAALAWQSAAQRPTGLIDLPTVDFDSPPDTAFAVQLLAPLCELARRRSTALPHARAIADGLARFLIPAACGIIGRGFRTPNHRWVVCSALAQAAALFPGEVDAAAYVRSILAETIDINADGEYSERSTGVYSAVCNRSLRLLADAFDMPELLDHVRANLNFMAALLNPDGHVVTSISLRQDHGRKVVPITMADSYFDLAQRDGNGSWAHIADLLLARHAESDDRHNLQHWPAWLVHPFAMNPAYLRESLPRTPLPASRRDFFPASGLWRVCDGPLSALATAGNACAFSLTYGDVELKALRLRGTYMHYADFHADQIERTPEGVHLTHLGDRRETPGWDLPLNRPVRFSNPHHGYYQLAADGTRQRWLLPKLDIHMDIRPVSHGFDLHLHTQGGFDRIPFLIELFFGAGGTLRTDGLTATPRAGETMLLRSGCAIYHSQSFGVSVAPGQADHEMLTLIHTPPVAGCFRLVLAHLSPLDTTVELRIGRWSAAQGKLLPDS